jgi:hypothetical protein
MSYSVSNVFAETGLNNVMRWVPFDMDELDLRNRIKNKMIRPTTIPQLMDELIIEQAIAREALRLAFVQHKSFAVGLKGVQQERTISDTFEQKATGETLVDMMSLKLLVGSGGVLSHAPRRNQAAMMLIDAFLPEGVTHIAVDSIFMMPQLGVLSTVHAEAATQVFERDCLIHLGTCIAPVGPSKEGKIVLSADIELPSGRQQLEMSFGELKLVPLAVGEKARVKARPVRGLDLGAGKGTEIDVEVEGGVVGLIFDARGRNPFVLPVEADARVPKLIEWIRALDAYPQAALER